MGAPAPKLVHYNAKDFDFGKKKAFPMRDQHFFTSIEKAQADLDWAPEFGLEEVRGEGGGGGGVHVTEW